MSRIFTTSIFLLFVFTMSGQVANGDFEQISSNGTLAHWGRIYIFSVTIDTTGNNPDSFVIDEKFYQPTTDAHTGNWALELRNAHNYFTGESMNGGASSFADSLFSGFSALNTLEPGSRPTSLEFYYKYFPAGNDFGYAHLTLYDYNDNELGAAIALISGAANEYKLISVPVEYTLPGDAAYYTLEFSTAAPGSAISFGTRFLIDDVTFGTTSSTEEIGTDKSFPLIYPNPATSNINMKSSDPASMIIYDINGKKVRTVSSMPADVSDLPAGTYILKVNDKFNSKSLQFVVH